MNKRLKVVLFVLIGMVSFFGLVIGGYFLLSSAYSATIYNLQIFDEDGNAMNDISRNLISTDKNYVKLNVSVDASDSQQIVYFSSSNPDVAKVVLEDEQYVLKYFSAGSATITAYSAIVPEVRDSFIITVHQNFVDNVVISSSVDNRFSLCADGSTYSYVYEAFGLENDESGDNDQIYDGMLLRVVDNYDKDVFQRISIDQSNRSINILTNTVIYDSTQVFYLQSYYVDDEQVEHIVKNFAYYVDVIGKRLVDIQLLLSEDFNFSGDTGHVYLSTEPYDKFLFLEYNDVVVNNIVLSEKVSNLCFKIRLIYSNNNIADASEYTDILPYCNNDPACLTIVGSSALGSNYWRIEFDKSKYHGDVGEIVQSFKLSYSEDIVQGQSSSIEKTFEVVFKCEETEDNSVYQNFVNNNLYASVVEKGQEDEVLYYEYIYWDTRYKNTNAKCDKNGNIIGFNDSYQPTPEYKMVIDKSGGFLYYTNTSGEYFDRNLNQISDPNNSTNTN